MDAAYFLRRRTRFIRFYYQTGVEPFREMQRKISEEESPYDEWPPGFDPEYGEPAYLDEWIEADNAAQVVGRSAVSVLSDTLKLYFKALERQLHFQLSSDGRKMASREGFIAAYRAAIGERLAAVWSDCPVRFDVIEQVILARNRAQHGEDILILNPSHDPKTLSKHPDPIFASEGEVREWKERGGDPDSWTVPRLDITPENLSAAIDETEKLATWVEERIEEMLARR